MQNDYDTDEFGVDDREVPIEEPDFFEKAFGKRPESGYEFRYLDFTIAWRSILFKWGCTGVGFGEYVLQFTENGFQVDDEMMGKEFGIILLDEAIKRIGSGQKAYVSKSLNPVVRKWYEILHTLGKPYYPECMGYKNVASKEGHEEFIKNVCLAYKNYLMKLPDEKPKA